MQEKAREVLVGTFRVSQRLLEGNLNLALTFRLVIAVDAGHLMLVDIQVVVVRLMTVI
jgi:hypothetical protein